MNVISSFADVPAALRNGVLSIGNFDGVHRGHARMLSTAKVEARRRNVPFLIMTFDPHPSMVLRPGTIRTPLTTLSQRQELLGRFEPELLLVIPPTREFLALMPEEFLASVVRDALGATLLVEGPTFSFGRGAKGSVDVLLAEGPAYGFETLVIPTEQTALSDLSLVNVSSTLIRWLVGQGRVADAGKCLDRPYTLRGEVVHGAQRGRSIGFPTANVATPQLLPAAGVYAGAAVIEGITHRAAISVGTNPTFHGTLTTVEAFVLDFDGDLYGKTVDIEFHRWLRDMYAFGGVEPLVAQMNRDVAATRELVSLNTAAALAR